MAEAQQGWVTENTLRQWGARGCLANVRGCQLKIRGRGWMQKKKPLVHRSLAGCSSCVSVAFDWSSQEGPWRGAGCLGTAMSRGKAGATGTC